jgi:hypothetical protein
MDRAPISYSQSLQAILCVNKWFDCFKALQLGGGQATTFQHSSYISQDITCFDRKPLYALHKQCSDKGCTEPTVTRKPWQLVLKLRCNKRSAYMETPTTPASKTRPHFETRTCLGEDKGWNDCAGEGHQQFNGPTELATCLTVTKIWSWAPGGVWQQARLADWLENQSLAAENRYSSTCRHELDTRESLAREDNSRRTWEAKQ